MITRFLLLFCWLAGTTPLWAQTTSDASLPQWYGGIQYGRQDYQLFFFRDPEPGRTNARRPQLTAGYQFTPRWTLQIGVAPVRNSFSSSGAGTNLAGQPVSERYASTTRSLAVPLLARYTLAARSWKNLRVDVLAGGVAFWSRGETHFIRTENGVITTDFHQTRALMNAFAALGPGVRYGLGRHVEVTAEWLFYKNLKSTSAFYQLNSTGNKTGVTNSVMVGVRYRFGPTSPAQPVGREQR